MQQRSFRFVRNDNLVSRQRSGHLGQQIAGFAATHTGWFLLSASEVIVHFVASDRAEPTAERVAGSFATEAIEVSRNGLEHFLKHIGGIVRLQPPTPAPRQHERRVQRNESFPCGSISGACSVEQAPVRAHLRGLIVPVDGSRVLHGVPGSGQQWGGFVTVCATVGAMSMKNHCVTPYR